MDTTSTSAATHRANAAACFARSAASFDSCDTDGFLSQHSSTLMGNLHNLRADLAEKGGLIEVSALFLLDGTLASTHVGHGQFGAYWVLNDGAAELLGRRFLSTSEAASPKRRQANNAKKGVSVGTISVAGYCDLVGGQGGVATVYPATLPVVSDLIEGRFTVVTTDADAA